MSIPWLLVSGDFSPFGGMDQANYQLAWHLADRLGHTVHLVCHRVAQPLATHANVRVHTVSRPLGRHAFGGPLLNRTGKRLARTLSAVDPRTRVIVNGANCSWPGVNWVHMVQRACPASDAGAPWTFRLKNRLMRFWERWQERRVLHSNPLVVANSRKTRQELVDLVGIRAERIQVVYLGVDPTVFRPFTPQEQVQARAQLGLPDNTRVFLFVGALGYDRNKGFDTLLAAWHRLCWSKISPRFLLAAGGGRLNSWKQEIERFGLSDSVRLVGHTSKIQTLMAAADGLISPTRYDAYGLAVHEALCCNLPALVTRAAGIAERYPPELQDLLCNDPNNIDELTQRIRKLCQELPHYRDRVTPFAATLRSRTWADMAQEMVDLILA